VSHRDDRYVFTSESVTDGHPDKIADQISDAILDAVMADDPNGRVACETLVTTGMAMIAGEISTTTYVDFPALVRQTIRDIGYTRAKFGFDSETCAVLSSIDPQSPDIAMGVDTGGAGDQGIMFGFACDETEELMPMPLMLSHRLATTPARTCAETGQLEWLRPDGKTQVSVEYDEGRPARVAAVVISTQHAEDITIEELRSAIAESIIDAGDALRTWSTTTPRSTSIRQAGS
jgi:S-adenosylmethionine synthetase